MGYGADNISVSVVLEPLPTIGVAFNTVLFLVDLANNSLNGDTFRTYNSSQDVIDDEDAGYISSATSQSGQDFFAQPGNEKVLLIGSVDLVGGDVYSDALADCVAGGANFYAVALNIKASADAAAQATFSGSIETGGEYLYFLQSDEATWLTASYPAGLTAVEGRERTVICWHDTSTEDFALCWAGNRFDNDIDQRATGWPCSLAEVAAYATALTSTQEGFAEGNEVNLIKAWGNATSWVDNGVTAGLAASNGRPIEHIVASDWFRTNLQNDLSTLVQTLAARHEKIPISKGGQQLILNEITKRLNLGIAAGHFLTESPTGTGEITEARALNIEAADITAKRLRFEVRIILSTGVRVINVAAYATAL